jgi:starch phosphorylase
MWHNIWPNLPREEIPIRSITNGVHPQSWISHDINELYQSYFGPAFVESPGAPELWERVHRIPDVELWRIHQKRRERLVFFARKRLKQQLVRRGASQYDIQQADQVLSSQILTVGFARRFSTYKRGTLIFHDIDRLETIINNEEFPVQLVVSGKAHPLDNPGKELIRQIISYAEDERFRNRVIFLEDYDINVARYLVQGCDVWLNNPRRPQEASGTSGMKAALNGALNVSILDGWWVEGYNEETGFKIGNGEEYDNVETQDRLESEALYNVLEREVIPLFYERNTNKLPVRWVSRMKAAIHMAGQRFSAQRMLMDYCHHFYVPAIRASLKMAEDDFKLNREVTAWMDRISTSWDEIVLSDVEVALAGDTVHVGQEVPVRMKVHLGSITPDDVRIEIVAGKINSQDQFLDYHPVSARIESSQSGDTDRNGVYHYTGSVECRESGRFGITARVIPRSEHLVHTRKPKLISWW